LKYVSLQKMVSAVAVWFGHVPRSMLQILLLLGRRWSPTWMLIWEYRTITSESRLVKWLAVARDKTTMKC